MQISFKECHDRKERRLKASGDLPTDAKLTFEQVSKETGVTSRTIAKYYQGRDMRFFVGDVLIPLMEYYDCELGDILDGCYTPNLWTTPSRPRDGLSQLFEAYGLH